MKDQSNKRGSKCKIRFEKFRVLKPDSFFKFLWDLFFISNVMIFGVLVPVDAAFFNIESKFSKSLSIYTSCLYLTDIFVTLNSGIYIKGEQVLKRSVIVKKYILFYFWIDALSTVPFDLIYHMILIDKDKSSFSLNQNLINLKLLKLFRLLRLSRVEKVIIKVEDRLTSQTNFFILKVMKILYYLFLVANATACLMYLVSSQSMAPDSFISLISDQGATEPNELYVASLYWAFVTMVSIGYGDLHPSTTSERIVGILIMNCSSITFGFLAGNFGTIVAKHTKKDKEKREILTNMIQLIKHHKLNVDIKRRSVDYINYLYSQSQNQIDLKELLQDLSFALKEEVFTHINGKLIEGFLVFKGLGFKCISRISRILTPQVNSPNDIIFRENDEASNMFFITKGVVQVIDLKTSSCISFLSNNEYFGEIGMFMRRPRSASIYCLHFTETLTLDYSQLRKISSQFPVLSSKLQQIKEFSKKQDMSVLEIVCYLCKEKGHLAKNCEVMTEKEKNKSKWLKNRNKTQVLGESSQLFKNVYLKKEKKLSIQRIYTKNVLGRKRRLKDLYPFQQKFRNLIRDSDLIFGYQESSYSSRVSLFSRDEEVSEYLNSFKGYEHVIDSDEDNRLEELRIRSKKFDYDLIYSTQIKID